MHQLKGLSLGNGAMAAECMFLLENVPSDGLVIDFSQFQSPGVGATILLLVVQFL